MVLNRFNSYYQLDSRIAPAFAELIRAYNVFFNEKRVIESLYSLYLDLAYQLVENGEAYSSLDQLPKLFDKQRTMLVEKFKAQPIDRLNTYSYILFDKRYFIVERALNNIIKESMHDTAIYHVAFYCLNMVTLIFDALSFVLNLKLDQIYIKNLQNGLPPGKLKTIEKNLIQLFKIKIKNINNIPDDMGKAQDLFEAWSLQQGDLYTRTIQSATEKRNIATGIRDFAWSELVSGNSLAPNFEKDKQRLIKYHKPQYKAQLENSIKSGLTRDMLPSLGLDSFQSFVTHSGFIEAFSNQDVYKEFCEKLHNLRQRLRYHQGPIMKHNGQGGYSFVRPFMQHFAFIACQTGFIKP